MFTKVEESAEFEDPYYGEEEDDTLSLCDLPIYGDEAADECLEKYDTPFSSFSSSSSSYDEEFFEFSSPLEAMKPETIVFCGKLIPYKKKDIPSSTAPRKGQTFDGVSSPLEKYAGSGRKVSRGKSSSGPGWNLLLFGLAKFPGHVEMRDIKRRQSKGRGSSSRGLYGSRKSGGAGGEIVTGDDRVKGKGLWALLRAIGCMGQSANSMIKASLHCVPKI